MDQGLSPSASDDWQRVTAPSQNLSGSPGFAEPAKPIPLYHVQNPHFAPEQDHHPALVVEDRRTVEERLQDTLDVARLEQQKYAQRAKWASMAVNGAMFSQIILNALVTGLAATPNNRNAQIGVSALGAIGTIVASFLVRVRGTREPERSVSHAQNLEKFIRELQAFILDEGRSNDRKWDHSVKEFRAEFDDLQKAAHQSENGQPMSAGPRSTLGDSKAAV